MSDEEWVRLENHEWDCMCETCLSYDVFRAGQVEGSNGQIQVAGNPLRQGALAEKVREFRAAARRYREQLEAINRAALGGAQRMKTFYLAASSADIPKARAHAQDLLARGLEWWHDWTTAENWDVADEALPALAVLDVEAAKACDVFVMLADPVSPGAFLELGARLALGKVAHVVGGQHFFFEHPRIVKHSDWAAFLAA